MEDCKTIGTPANRKRRELQWVGWQWSQSSVSWGNMFFIIYKSDYSIRHSAISKRNHTFCKNPRKIHWTAVKWIFRYLKGTANYYLKYSKNTNGHITDWGNDKRDRKSINGCVFMLNGGAIIWYSKKQRAVALSLQ